MVERFNRNLKLVIHAANASGQDLEQEVEKYVAAYKSTPHAVTGQTSNKLMFNREISTKLPSLPVTPQGAHHREARKRDRAAKQQAKSRYDKKHRARQQELQEGDLVYRRRERPTTTKGPWETEPFEVTQVHHNQVTGDRQGQISLRDRRDWKLVKTRPAHLQLPDYDDHNNTRGQMPTIPEEGNFFTEDDLEDPSDLDVPRRPIMRSSRTSEHGDAPPNHPITREDDLPSTEGDEVRSGIREFSPEPTQEGDLSPGGENTPKCPVRPK